MYLHIYEKTNSIFIHFQYISSTNINESTARATRSQRSALRSLPTVDRARRPGGSSALRQACTDTVVCAKRRINRPRLGGLHTMCLLPYHRLCERPELFLLSPLRAMKGTFWSFVMAQPLSCAKVSRHVGSCTELL